MSDRRAKILRRTRVGGALALGTTGVLYGTSLSFGGPLVTGLCLVFALWSVWELHGMGYLGSPERALAVAAGVVTVPLVLRMAGHENPLLDPEWGPRTRHAATLAWSAAIALGAATLGALPSAWRRPASLLRVLGCTAWVGLSLGWVPVLHAQAGTRALVALVVLSKIGDTAGYYFGNWLGVTHPFPRLSPGKTTAGCVASLVAGLLAGLGCQALGLFPDARYGWLSGLVAGALVNLASQAGDLLESATKRATGVKDSATTFGPSGGLLDLVDSVLLSAPVAVLSWPLLFRWAYGG